MTTTAAMLALDDFHQALVNAVDGWNRLPHGKPPVVWHEHDQRFVQRADRYGPEMDQAFRAARQAVWTVTMFAPKRVVRPMVQVYDVMARKAVELGGVNSAHYDSPRRDSPLHIDEPQFPETAWDELRNAIRRDLGVRALRPNVGHYE